MRSDLNILPYTDYRYIFLVDEYFSFNADAYIRI